MLANGENKELLLATVDSRTATGHALPITLQGGQATEFPLPPAMPDAVLLLRLLSSSHIADLHAITDVIRNDVGLTVQLFCLAALERSDRATNTLNVGDLVVQIGLEKLKSLAAETGLNPYHPQNASSQPRERFWMHARLTARIAEELAGETSIARESAYVAGMLRHMGALPELLEWKLPEGKPGAEEIGYRMAKAWHFPTVLADVIRGDERSCTSQKSHSLLRLVNVADERAARWESAGISAPSTLACC